MPTDGAKKAFEERNMDCRGERGIELVTVRV